MSLPAPSLRRAALASVIANVGIVLTGGIVRVTGSGLGCAEWPTCDGTSVVPRGGEEAAWHAAIEFGNRLLTFVLLVVAIWVVLAARRHTRRDVVVQRLAWAQPAGIVAQAVLGGITVLTDLNPLVVAAHFLLSALLIAAAVVLHERVTVAERADTDGVLRWLGLALVPVGFTVLLLGTLVTAAGPHAGDPGTPRLGLDIRTMAVAHADGVWLLIGLTVAVVLVAQALGVRRARDLALALLAIEVAQGGIGYTQYALGIPPGLVALHLLGAALVWVAVMRLALALQPPRRGEADRDPATGARVSATA